MRSLIFGFWAWNSCTNSLSPLAVARRWMNISSLLFSTLRQRPIAKALIHYEIFYCVVAHNTLCPSPGFKRKNFQWKKCWLSFYLHSQSVFLFLVYITTKFISRCWAKQVAIHKVIFLLSPTDVCHRCLNDEWWFFSPTENTIPPERDNGAWADNASSQLATFPVFSEINTGLIVCALRPIFSLFIIALLARLISGLIAANEQYSLPLTTRSLITWLGFPFPRDLLSAAY